MHDQRAEDAEIQKENELELGMNSDEHLLSLTISTFGISHKIDLLGMLLPRVQIMVTTVSGM